MDSDRTPGVTGVVRDQDAADRQLRVALLSYPSKPHCGGQGVYLRHLSRELSVPGHQVEVFSSQPYPDLKPGPLLTPAVAAPYQ
jgi:hypothetical protein